MIDNDVLNMEKTSENRKRKKQALPANLKKIDTSVNGDAVRLVEEQRIVERKLYPLRIDQRTVIYVTKDKCTPEYAENRRKQLKSSPVVEKKGGPDCKNIDVDVVRTLLKSGMYLKDIAKKLGVSTPTINKYMKEYDFKNGNKQ